MSHVTRLPKQHPNKPHCATCDKQLPTFNSMQLSFSEEELGATEVLTITFRVRCVCGAEWDMKKDAK